MTHPTNRRDFFRINDNIGLTINPLEEDTIDLDSVFEKRRKEYGLANEFIIQKERHRPLLFKIQQSDQNLAKYIEFLEENLLSLAIISNRHMTELPDKPDHAVNLSGSGLRFLSDKEWSSECFLQLSITLFPNLLTVYAIGKVLRKEKTASGKWSIALRFTHIHHADKEALVRHVHARQLASFRNMASNENS